MTNPLPNVRHGAIFARLTGSLGTVLLTDGEISKVVPVLREGYLQRLRYWCSSAAFARLVRIKVSTEGSQDWYITPGGQDDDLGVVRWVGEGQKCIISLVRGEDVDVSLLPAFLATETVRLEVFG